MLFVVGSSFIKARLMSAQLESLSKTTVITAIFKQLKSQCFNPSFTSPLDLKELFTLNTMVMDHTAAACCSTSCRNRFLPEYAERKIYRNVKFELLFLHNLL